MEDWKLLFCDWFALSHPPVTLLTIMLKQFIPDHKRRNRNRNRNRNRYGNNDAAFDNA